MRCDLSLIPRINHHTRFLTMACAVVVLVVAALALDGSRTVSADHPPACDVNDLGALGADPGSELRADGRWTTEDCDSRFRSGSDAHTYRFEIAEAGRIRIGLGSTGADSYLYLLAGDGSRITDNDDGAAGLGARIEVELEPGSYLVEATTVGGRGRGAADFSLAIERLSCDLIDLGLLVPGADLTASGAWTIDTCGSRIVAAHPAYNYTFILPEPGRVRIDLLSENGDPVLSLASPAQGVIGANDDGGDARNARIEQYLPAGLYVVEATTYLRRDLQPIGADFTLVVRLVDEPAAQQDFLLKIEDTLAPNEVIAGEPFAVDYRVGNIGRGELPDGAILVLYVVGPRVREIGTPDLRCARRLGARRLLPLRRRHCHRHQHRARVGGAVRGHLQPTRPRLGVRCGHRLSKDSTRPANSVRRSAGTVSGAT